MSDLQQQVNELKAELLNMCLAARSVWDGDESYAELGALEFEIAKKYEWPWSEWCEPCDWEGTVDGQTCALCGGRGMRYYFYEGGKEQYLDPADPRIEAIDRAVGKEPMGPRPGEGTDAAT